MQLQLSPNPNEPMLCPDLETAAQIVRQQHPPPHFIVAPEYSERPPRMDESSFNEQRAFRQFIEETGFVIMDELDLVSGVPGVSTKRWGKRILFVHPKK